MNKELMVVGIDVSKDKLDLCLLPSGEHWQLANTREALAAWMADCPAVPAMCVLEATGGYERLSVGVLQAADWPVALVNPRQARDFAKACGQLAKTDAIDARILAELGRRLEPRTLTPAEPMRQQLEALATRRQQYVQMLAMEKTRRAQVPEGTVRRDLEQHIAWIEARLSELDENLTVLLAEQPALQARLEQLCTVKGIGVKTARTLVIELPELGQINHKQLAALAGLAPLARDSGSRRGQRCIRGGRAPVRTALYQAALSARQFNPAVHALAERLRARGKAPKLILIACAHKLLRILSGLVKNNTTWRADFQSLAT